MDIRLTPSLQTRLRPRRITERDILDVFLEGNYSAPCGKGLKRLVGREKARGRLVVDYQEQGELQYLIVEAHWKE